MGIAMVPRCDKKETKPTTGTVTSKKTSNGRNVPSKKPNAVAKNTSAKPAMVAPTSEKKKRKRANTKMADAPKEVTTKEQEPPPTDDSEDEDELLAAAQAWAKDPERKEEEPELDYNDDDDDDKLYSLHVTQLSYEANEPDIRTIFAEAGCLISSIRLVYDGMGAERTFRGVAFLDMCDEESYKKALALNRRMLHGRRMNVRPTKSKDELIDIVARTKELVAMKIQRQKDKQEAKENPDVDKKEKKSDRKERKKSEKKDKKKRKSEKGDVSSSPNKKARTLMSDDGAKPDVVEAFPNDVKKPEASDLQASDKTQPEDDGNTSKSDVKKAKANATLASSATARPIAAKRAPGSAEKPKITKKERNKKAAILMAKRRGK
jgi:RNA recognition motif-containing protein